MRRAGNSKGCLYFGLMLTSDGPKVIEYNCRFGDPETQVVLPRLKTDFVDIITAVAEERLSQLSIEWSEEACACVVMASGGYPGSYQKGLKFTDWMRTVRWRALWSITLAPDWIMQAIRENAVFDKRWKSAGNNCPRENIA